MSQTWDFAGISAERHRLLWTPFEFSDLIEQINLEASRLRYRREKGLMERRGPGGAGWGNVKLKF